VQVLYKSNAPCYCLRKAFGRFTSIALRFENPGMQALVLLFQSPYSSCEESICW
jgi:hypothetical protein